MSLRYCFSASIFLESILFLLGAAPAQAQFTVEGTVTDTATQEPLPGVNIFDQNDLKVVDFGVFAL